jgi:hypothetical protein
LNADGDVAFSAALTPPDNDQIEWGTGLFVAYAAAAGIFADGFETGDTSAWASVTP